MNFLTFLMNFWLNLFFLSKNRIEKHGVGRESALGVLSLSLPRFARLKFRDGPWSDPSILLTQSK